MDILRGLKNLYIVHVSNQSTTNMMNMKKTKMFSFCRETIKEYG